MIKKFLLLVYLFIPQLAVAEEYSVEGVLSGDVLTIYDFGYSSKSPDCRKFMDDWVEKLTNHIAANPSSARAYYFRGALYKLKPTCWRNTDAALKSLVREVFLSSSLVTGSNENMNSDWDKALKISVESSSGEALPLEILDKMYSPFINPEVVEKRDKLKVKIAPDILGEGTDHPMFKGVYTLIKYEVIADKYNDADDRDNVLRILRELAKISPEGAIKANELIPLYEEAWRERDAKALELEKASEEKPIKAESKSEPKSKRKSEIETMAEEPEASTAVVPAPEATITSPVVKPVEPAPSFVNVAIDWIKNFTPYFIAIGLVIILYVFGRSKKKA